LPRLLRIRPGTELSGGQLKARVASVAGSNGTVWTGELSTSAVRAVRDGKPIVWDQPLRAGFAVRLGPDHWPIFDKLEVQSDFVGLAARGSAEEFAAAATVDLSRLAERLHDFVDLEGVQLAGLAEVRLNTKPAPGGGFAVDAKATLTRFAAVDVKGVGLREPELTVALTATAKKGNGVVGVNIGKLTVAAAGDSAEVTLTEPVADVAKLTSGRAAVAASGDLARWQNRLRPFVPLPADPALNGKGKLTGTVAVANRKIGFDGALTVEQFVVGPVSKPSWTEPTVALAAKGEFDVPGDAVRLERLKMDREGLAAEASGSVAGLSTTQDVKLDGTLAYDLKKLEPKLKEFLGKGAAVSGADRRPFRIAGKLGDNKNPVANLTGSAAVGWQSVKAYGFDVGPADLTATLDHGSVAFSPVAATFGGGQVRLTPTLDLQPDAYSLSFAKGKVIDKAKLTPVACADAIGFVLPAVAKAARAEGTISLDMADNHIPLADPTKAAMKGTLTLHAVKVSPGPVMTEIATLLGATNVTVTLANEQAVAVKVENGRVYHDKLSLDVRGYAVTTSGSVGFDGSLNLVADLPLPARLIDQALADRPILKDALAKKRVSVTIGGTLDKPRLDPKAAQAAAQKLVQEAVKSAADEALKKGLQGLLPKK
jgi:translocation and assembly module TamB